MGSANGHGVKAETCLIMMGERGHPTPGRAKERRRTMRVREDPGNAGTQTPLHYISRD